MASPSAPSEIVANYSPLKVVAWSGGWAVVFGYVLFTLVSNDWQTPPGRTGHLYWGALPASACLVVIGIVLALKVLRVRGVAIARYGDELQVNFAMASRRISLRGLLVTAIPKQISVRGSLHTANALVDQVTLHVPGGGPPISFATGLLHERARDIAQKIDGLILAGRSETTL